MYILLDYHICARRSHSWRSRQGRKPAERPRRACWYSGYYPTALNTLQSRALHLVWGLNLTMGRSISRSR